MGLYVKHVGWRADFDKTRRVGHGSAVPWLKKVLTGVFGCNAPPTPAMTENLIDSPLTKSAG